MSVKEKIRLAIVKQFLANGLHGFGKHTSLAADAAYSVWPKKRTLSQNAYWNAAVVRTMANELGYFEHEMKAILELQFNPIEVKCMDGITRTMGGSMANLPVKEFGDKIDKAIMWAAIEHNIVIEPPPKKPKNARSESAE